MDQKQAVLDTVDKLLDAVFKKDLKAYLECCSESLTAFEPEARGAFVEGVNFHKYYFGIPAEPAEFINHTKTNVNVRIIGTAAVVTYVLLYQKLDPTTAIPITISFEETRIFEKENDEWKMVHMHRSLPSR